MDDLKYDGSLVVYVCHSHIHIHAKKAQLCEPQAFSKSVSLSSKIAATGCLTRPQGLKLNKCPEGAIGALRINVISNPDFTWKTVYAGPSLRPRR